MNVSEVHTTFSSITTYITTNINTNITTNITTITQAPLAASTSAATSSASSPVTCDSLTGLQCVTLRLWQVVTPVIVVLGLLGNALVVVIFSRLNFSKSSTLVHLFVLALTDSLIMCLGPTRYWILNVFDYDVRLVSSAGCKLHLFLLYVSLDFSAWVLVSVSVERAVCVLRPLHVRGWFTVRRTLCRLLVICLVLCLVNGHYFFSNAIVVKTETVVSSLSESSSPEGKTYSTLYSQSSINVFTESSSIPTKSSLVSTEDSSVFPEVSSVFSVVNTTACSQCNSTTGADSGEHKPPIHVYNDCDSITAKWEDFEELTFVYIDLCFDSLAPLLIMVICNTLIIVSLRKQTKHRPHSSTRREIIAASRQTNGGYSDPLAAPDSSTGVQQERSDTSPSSHTTTCSTGRLGNVPPTLSLLRRSGRQASPSSARSHSYRSRAFHSANDPSLNGGSNNNVNDSRQSRESEGVYAQNSQQEDRRDAAVALPEIRLHSDQEEGCSQKGVGRRRYSKMRPRRERNSATEDQRSVGCSKHDKTERRKHAGPVLSSPDPSPEHAAQTTETTTSSSSLPLSHSLGPSSPEHSPLANGRKCSYSKRRTAEWRRSSPANPDLPQDLQAGSREPANPQPQPQPQSRPRNNLVSAGVTRMLVLVTTVFLMTTMPSAIYYIVDSYVREPQTDTRTNQVLNLMQALTNLLQFSNYGINFLLYSFRSKRFRLEVKYLLGTVDSRFRRHYHSSVLSGTKYSKRQSSSVKTRMARESRDTSTITSTTTTSPPRDPRSTPMSSSNGHVPRTCSDTDTISRDNPAFASEPEEIMYNTSRDNHSVELVEVVHSTSGENHSLAFESEVEVHSTSGGSRSLACEPEEEVHSTSGSKRSLAFEPEEKVDNRSAGNNCASGSKLEEEAPTTSEYAHSFATKSKEGMHNPLGNFEVDVHEYSTSGGDSVTAEQSGTLYEATESVQMSTCL